VRTSGSSAASHGEAPGGVGLVRRGTAWLRESRARVGTAGHRVRALALYIGMAGHPGVWRTCARMGAGAGSGQWAMAGLVRPAGSGSAREKEVGSTDQRETEKVG
jgi:hypothetical protein